MFEIIYENALLQVSTIDENVANEIPQLIEAWTGLSATDYYLTQNGRLVTSCFSDLLADVPLRVNGRLVGGKGGFGSMLRAIGAQIEKTTNREACRDLSGRRLRDINEEKRLKAYLDKQQDASEDERVKMQKKIEKLLSKPKHEFEDRQYEHQRSELVIETDEALQEGLQKAAEIEHAALVNDCPKASLPGKRKHPVVGVGMSKKKKSNLWLGNDDLSSSSETDSESGEDAGCSSGAKVSSSQSDEKETITTDEQPAPPLEGAVVSKSTILSG